MVNPRTVGILAVLIALAAPARAGSITLYGMNLQLANLGLLDAADPDGAYLFQLTLAADGYDAPEAVVLQGVDWVSAIAIDFDTRIASAAAIEPVDWDVLTGQATLGGVAEGGADWVSLAFRPGDVRLDGGTYTWLFALDISGDTASAPDTTASVAMVVSGLRLKPRRGTHTRAYLSEFHAGDVLDERAGFGGRSAGDANAGELTTVPEPGSLALLGCGLVGIWHSRRWTRRLSNTRR